jgi:hypothetical protein
MAHIEYTRLFSDPQGGSHFENATVELESHDYAPPAPPLGVSSGRSAEAIVFLALPVGWYGDWHPSPKAQWLVFMSGECEFETSDGELRRARAGDVVILDDTTGKGHRTRVVSDVAVAIAAVHT